VNEQEDGKTTGAQTHAGMSTRDVVGSVLSAAFGVQSSRNRERDFNSGSYRQFIIAGLIFTVLFVATLVVVVNVVLD
jgi:Na+-transporting NADH:ubiquinone oxidoreductase subunit NqrB